LAAKTYQSRLFGLPAHCEFIEAAQALAKPDDVRAYLPFLNGEPISYFYCPANDGVLAYDYLGSRACP
jgi:hypothetical protein